MIELNDYKNIAIIACYVFVIVLLSIFVDLAAGLRKAKQNNNVRTSFALRRTVTKFIQYEGSIIIAFSIDMLLHFCQIWNFINIISEVPFITLIVGIYNCICEFISVRENADQKLKKQRQKIDEAALKIIKELGTDKVKKIIDILDNDPPK